MYRNAYILLLLTTLFWGGNAVAGKLAVGHISPMLLTCVRWAGACLLLWLIGRRQLTDDMPTVRAALPMLLSLGFIGMEMATNFTNALMPDLTGHDEMGKISGTGFAFGYAGGVIALFIVLLFFAEDGTTGKTFIGLDPAFGLNAALREGTRSVGPFTAIWYAVFMLPFFLWVREPVLRGARQNVAQSLRGLWQSIRALGQRRSLANFLVSSMLYRDSLNAVYGLGGAYASNVMGWSVVQSGIFGILAAITAALFSWMGGYFDSRYGPKVVIVWSILALTAVIVVMVGLTPDSLFGQAFAAGSSMPNTIFYICGAVI
ncbi:MAG: MFS transporter, partial [Mesorhizobium sp.]|nr:MFS transporter [Mesorhizobium sp.]